MPPKLPPIVIGKPTTTLVSSEPTDKQEIKILFDGKTTSAVFGANDCWLDVKKFVKEHFKINEDLPHIKLYRRREGLEAACSAALISATSTATDVEAFVLPKPTRSFTIAVDDAPGRKYGRRKEITVTSDQEIFFCDTNIVRYLAAPSFKSLGVHSLCTSCSGSVETARQLAVHLDKLKRERKTRSRLVWDRPSSLFVGDEVCKAAAAAASAFSLRRLHR